jgi:glycosyltransferase involved in cell wall biosynthesis
VTIPDVSVVVPTRDRAGRLAQTLQTALAQRGVALELIVVDDGSTDETMDLLAAIDDSRLRVVSLASSQGVSTARNSGIAAATGSWIALLDDDDLWAPDKLSRQLDAALKAKRGWAYGGAVTVDEHLRVLAGGPPPDPERVANDVRHRNVVPAGSSNVVIRSDLLEEAGPFDIRMRHMADWDLWIRLAQLDPPACAPSPLVAYMIHAGNASLDPAGILAEMAVVDGRYAHLRDGAPIDSAYVHRWMAWSALRAGDRRSAIGSYRKAIKAGDWRSVGRCVVAAVYPGVAKSRYGWTGPDQQWSADAETWLGTLR